MAKIKARHAQRWAGVHAVAYGVRCACLWNWSKWYRAHVSAQASGQRKNPPGTAFAGDARLAKDYRDAELRDEHLTRMRAALAILENRGADLGNVDTVDTASIERVAVHMRDDTVHLVNLAPRSRYWAPTIADTMPGQPYHGWYVGTSKTKAEFDAEQAEREASQAARVEESRQNFNREQYDAAVRYLQGRTAA